MEIIGSFRLRDKLNNQLLYKIGLIIFFLLEKALIYHVNII